VCLHFKASFYLSHFNRARTTSECMCLNQETNQEIKKSRNQETKKQQNRTSPSAQAIILFYYDLFESRRSFLFAICIPPNVCMLFSSVDLISITFHIPSISFPFFLFNSLPFALCRVSSEAATNNLINKNNKTEKLKMCYRNYFYV